MENKAMVWDHIQQPEECFLLMAVRWAARASYLDLMLIFSISKAHCSSLWLTLEALVRKQVIVFRIGESQAPALLPGLPLGLPLEFLDPPLLSCILVP